MSKNIFPWVKPLGLSSSNFSDKPEGVDALVWGLKNNIISPDEYLDWATQFYQLPAIKPEFFSMAVDFTLLEKYANLYDWYAYCYPIYHWEGTLFVACLAPPKVKINGKVCYVIAPFHALESAWQKHDNAKPGVAMATEQLPIIPEAPSAQSPAPEMTATQVLQDKPQTPVETPQLNADLGLKDIDPTREQKFENAPPVQKTPSTEVQPQTIPDSPKVESTPKSVIESPEVKVQSQPTPELPKVEEPAQPVAEPVEVKAAAAPKANAVREQTQPVADTTGLDFGDLKKEMGVNEDQPEATSSNEEPMEPSEEVGVLDFSSMGSQALGEESANEPEQEVTQTKFDNDINNLTSATQTMHVHNHTMTATKHNTETPSLPFEEVTIKGISLEGEKTEIEKTPEEKTKVSPAAEQAQKLAEVMEQKQVEAKPLAPNVIIPPPPQPEQVKQELVKPAEAPQVFQDENSIPSLDDLKQHATINPAQAPGLDESDINLEQENKHLGQDEDAEGDIDDYTPVPILTKAQVEAQERRKKEAHIKEQAAEKSRLSENTITDHAQPILIPADNLISETDLQMAVNLDEATNLKHVIAHIFSHLKKDYQKLMWVEMKSEGQYFIQYVMGDWKITELAWKMHVNISNPNIFRVAHHSGFPYHGEINPNPYNDKYFEWWNRGKTPNFCTIFPVQHNDQIIGFISCFEKGDEFDDVGSLKKVENLITICKKTLQKFAPSKAA